MKITIIGVTGRIGKRVAKELVARGHAVLGVNRRPERVPAVLGEGLPFPTAKADTADFESLLNAVRGADAVLLATAPTREHTEDYPAHNRNVIAACKTAGVPRLVALSSHMALKAPDGRPMLEAVPPHPVFYRLEAVYAEDAVAFFAEKALDWLLVAPPAELFPYGQVTGRYRVGGDTLLVTDPDSADYKLTSTLSMEDLAHFLAGELTAPKHSRELVTVAY